MTTFYLNDLQKDLFEKWRKEQREKNPHIATIGGRWSFTFTPTGLGTSVEVKDNATGDKLDLTDWNEF